MDTMRPSTPISAVSLAFVVGFTSGCSALNPFDNPRQDRVEELADALHAKDFARAASLTNDPLTAEADIRKTFDNLGDSALDIDVPDIDGGARSYSLENTWTLPNGQTAQSEGALDFALDGRSEEIEWSPALFDGRLDTGGHLTFAENKTLTTPIVDRHGIPIMEWSTVTAISIDSKTPESSLDALAETTSSIDPSITADGFRAQIDAEEPGTRFAALSLREDDIAPLRSTIELLEGVTLSEQGKLLGSDPKISSPAFAGLPEYWTDKLDDGAGWSFSGTGPAGSFDIAAERPNELPSIRTSIDVPIQAAAQKAVDARQEPAVIVAVEPTSGGILGVAQNGSASAQGPIALSGSFPPGSTFKTVTTAAALGTGAADPDTVLPCPAQTTVDGRAIPNDENFDLGEVPLHTAFAQSCNTTQAMLSADLGADDMKDTAAQLGLGVDFDAPGITTITGQVPVTKNGPERVEAAIGQGTVTASPFGIALMEAAVANGGSVVPPWLIDGEATKASASPQPMDPKLAESLRAMMQETVSSGTASSLARFEGLGGKTGTAEVDGKSAHGWFAGVVDNVAFCAFIEGADSSGPAVTMSGDFLDSAGEAIYR